MRGVNMMKRALSILLLFGVIGVGVYEWPRLQRAQAAPDLKGSGTIEAEEINIGPEVSGRVVDVPANRGQPVHAGQVFFRLDDTLLSAQRAQAEAAVQTARAQRNQFVARARPEQLETATETIS